MQTVSAQGAEIPVLGVGNFTVAMMDESIRLAKSPIVTNQIEVHPYLDQSKVIAAAHGKTAAQVALRWLVQQGLVALSKTAKVKRVPENFAIFDFKLSDDEMVRIHRLARPDGRLVSPPNLAPAWDI